MLKKIARFILKDELLKNSSEMNMMSIQIDRLSELANMLNEQAEVIQTGRGYVFKPEHLTEADQLTLAKNINNDFIAILKKLLKMKADENADLLLHFPAETEAKRVGWSMAVRMYDDFVMQLERSEKLFSSKEALQKARDKYKK
jgi:hypothetical protein